MRSSALLVICIVMTTGLEAKAECSCENIECGNDGCGRSCGTCPAGMGCDPKTGRCVIAPPCCRAGAPDDPAIKACDCYDCVCMYMPECCKPKMPWTAACALVCLECGGACTCDFDCKGRECGNDGCGGSCGTCENGKVCIAGRCLGEYPERCLGETEASASSCYDGLTEEGCCDASGRAVWCGQDDKLYCLDCGDAQCTYAQGIGVICGPPGSAPGPECAGGPCVGKCKGRNCGDDGCGGVCGFCREGEVCKDGKCWCVPDCKDKECGPAAPCGGTCGYCKNGKVCVDFRCVDPVEPLGETVETVAEAEAVGNGCSSTGYGCYWISVFVVIFGFIKTLRMGRID